MELVKPLWLAWDRLRWAPMLLGLTRESVDSASLVGSMLGLDKAVVEDLLRLMYPGKADDLIVAADALREAVRDMLPSQDDPVDAPRRLAWLHTLAGLQANPGQQVRFDEQALEQLARTLLDWVEERLVQSQREEVEVVIFAHSMGTIIVNEILRRSAWSPTPNFKDIVFMGAACSIRDYEDSVFPYLARRKSYGTQFHNLMLHPRAEEEEVMALEVLPRGSLLVYIDKYLANPSTVRDRTLGRFENIMLSLDRTQPEVAEQIHMKVFSVGAGARASNQPDTHGGFTPATYWQEPFFRTKRQLRARDASRAPAGGPPVGK